MTFYPNADEARDEIPDSEMSDEELEGHWRDATTTSVSGYYLPD